MSRKYGHRGYQDNDRDSGSSSGSRERGQSQAPRRELTKEEQIQKRSLRHAIDREANEVVRCPTCGRAADASKPISFDSHCFNCSAPLHCCRTCKNFDSQARFECRVEITEAIGDKNKGNHCDQYSPRMVLDSTGRRSTKSATGRASNDPRSQFENLFKR